MNSDENPNSKTGNPTELALLKFFSYQDFDIMEYRNNFPDKIFDAPFNSDRKRMSKIYTIKGETFVFMKGASEYMLKSSSHFHHMKTNQIHPITKDLHKDLENAINLMATQSLRTIGLCYKKIAPSDLDQSKVDAQGVYEYEKNGFTIIGIAGIKDIIRQGVTESIKQCHLAGIDVKMVTGDNKITARAIAEEINIISPEERESALVMEGPEFLEKIGGIICENCEFKETCDCVNNQYQLDKPENKGKKVRKDKIKNGDAFDEIW